MLKIGIIGLGDIALKAYLPVISKRKVEVHLCSRNETKLREISDQYRFTHQHQSVASLISNRIDAAFVHASTSSHDEIVEQLLNNNIHVYVDKPLTYDFASSEKLVQLAEQKNILLAVGFNRRFAPAYQHLKELVNPNMIILQKNRTSLPGDVRTFIFDDFIHVIDTLLFLFPHTIDKIIVNGRKQGDQLYHVVIQFIAANGAIAIGIMNRDSGTIEEKLEVFTSSEKRVVYNVTDATRLQDRQETKLGTNDWESTLHKRGFEQIVDNFLEALPFAKTSLPNNKSILHTHKICEEVVEKLNAL